MSSLASLLLQAVISLLLLVQANPQLNASLREQAIAIANQAIKVATEQTGGTQTTSPAMQATQPTTVTTPTTTTTTSTNPALPSGGGGSAGGPGVVAAPSGNLPPTFYRITPVPYNVRVGEEFSFTWKGSDPNNDDLGWSVDWGTGGVGSGCYPSNTTFTQSHAWSMPGTYTVKVTVSDCKGGSSVHIFTMNVIPPSPSSTPSIHTLNPASGPYFTRVTITGTGFTPIGNRIRFGNLHTENDPSYNLISTNGTTLTFTVPKYPYVSCQNSNPCIQFSGSGQTGTFDVSVINTNGTSNSLSFTTLPPEFPEP